MQKCWQNLLLGKKECWSSGRNLAEWVNQNPDHWTFSGFVLKQGLAWKWSRKMKYTMVPGIRQRSNKGKKELLIERYSFSFHVLLASLSVLECSQQPAARLGSIIKFKLWGRFEAPVNKGHLGIYYHSGRAKPFRSVFQVPKEHNFFFLEGERFIKVQQMGSVEWLPFNTLHGYWFQKSDF